MSWTLGFVDCGDQDAIDAALTARRLTPLHRAVRGRAVIAAGGIPETCRVRTAAAPDNGIEIVLGLGMTEGGAAACVAIDDRETRIANDSLALRTMYLRRWRGGLVFSTRLDLLAATTGVREVDLSVLGAQWLTFNRWTSDPLVTDTLALGQGGVARYHHGKLDIASSPWKPVPGPDSAHELAEVLLRAASHPDASLGLSGGVDSRVLLALQLGAGVPTRAHVFGAEDDPDVRVAQRIAREHGLDLQHLAPRLPPIDACIRRMERHAAEAQAIVPASQALKVLPYETLHQQGRMVVDGGFGEIARRQFLNRLLLRAPKHLRDRNAAAVLPYVSFARGRIFAPDVSDRMRAGAVEQLAMALSGLEDQRHRPLEDQADLLAIRTRLPWYFGIEQARMDARVRSMMPFATPEALQSVMGLPLHLRRRGRLMKRLITSAAPSLGRIPVAKGDRVLPLGTPRELAWVLARLPYPRKPRGASFRDEFLEHVGPFVRDTVASRAFMECPLYDHAVVRALVDRYYAGERSLGVTLDWFLALEAWRRSVS